MLNNRSELRPTIENVAGELAMLLWDRRVHERFSGIVRSNQQLNAAAQGGNPLILGVRRWWAISTALTLRRHVDSGFQGTLRWVVEHLAVLEQQHHGVLPVENEFIKALERLDGISRQFRPYLNALIHAGVPGAASSPSVTFGDLADAIDAVRQIAERAYVAITNVSRHLEPVEQFDWTEIFEVPWIQSDAKMAYELGTPGVPFDALPMSAWDEKSVSRLQMQIIKKNDCVASVSVSCAGPAPALDVRVFLPHFGTVIEAEEINPGAEAIQNIVWPANAESKIGYGQAVLEFADNTDRIYRQYADVDVQAARVRRLTLTPFQVEGRIVSQRPFAIAT